LSDSVIENLIKHYRNENVLWDVIMRIYEFKTKGCRLVAH